VIFFLLPTIVLTGLTMSPAVTASHPYLLNLFFGAQSARTIHFFAATLLLFFVLIHVLMIIKSGFKRQMNAMLLNK
jgi:thiosulfate reductase cytochrome b subunit